MTDPTADEKLRAALHPYNSRAEFYAHLVDRLVFELKYRREAYDKATEGLERGKMVRNSAKDFDLPDIPGQFEPMRGDYPTCSKEATRLNEVQLQSGFLHYLFWADVAAA